MNFRLLLPLPLGFAALAAAAFAKPGKTEPAPGAVRPRIVTEAVKHDTDDPAIWINRADPAASLVLGTDKHADGALYVFGRDGFTEDREGLSIYPTAPGRGYLLVSDQQANTFCVFPREGTPGQPHDHRCLHTIDVSTIESDGSEVTPVALPGFPGGLFVAMTNGRTFHFYAWDDLKAAMHRPAALPAPAR